MSIGLWIILLVIAGFVDTIIRVFFQNKEREKLGNGMLLAATDNAKKLYSLFHKAIAVNLKRFGIVGNFSIDEVLVDGKYKYIGQQNYIGIGIVKGKKIYTTDEILENLQKYVQNTGNVFGAFSDIIDNKYIVEIYLRDDIAREFIWDDKDLFNNVEVGDEVSLNYDKQYCMGIGYLEKENEKNYKNQRPDVGRT